MRYPGILLVALRSGHYAVTEHFGLGERDGRPQAVHHDMDHLGDTDLVIEIFASRLAGLSSTPALMRAEGVPAALLSTWKKSTHSPLLRLRVRSTRFRS